MQVQELEMSEEVISLIIYSTNMQHTGFLLLNFLLGLYFILQVISQPFKISAYLLYIA